MKKTALDRAVFALLALALLIVSVSLPPHPVNTAYEFPVQPGTEEWIRLGGTEARAEACRLPEGLAERMTSEALLETALDYPFSADLFAFSSLEQGYQAVLVKNDALRELVTRPDAVQVMEAALSSAVSSLSSDPNAVLRETLLGAFYTCLAAEAA